MAWRTFPYSDPHYCYTKNSLKKAWSRLHTGDVESFPKDPALADAWIAFHAGEFEKAAESGLALGLDGYSVANKASCIYANYLEKSREKKAKLFEEVVERCDTQQIERPDEASGYYWKAYALGRYSQDISIIEALSQGIGNKVKKNLDMTISLAPKHADAYIALGVYHAEIINKVGALIGGLSYGAKKEIGLSMFEKALTLHPQSAIARIEYANGLLMLEGKKRIADALSMYRQAAAFEAKDAMERLDVQWAIDELKDR